MADIDRRAFTLLLARSDVAALMRPSDYLVAVETAFLAAKGGRATAPPPMHIAGHGGAFHAKGASLYGDTGYVALKLNANFPGNPGRGLPTIQGVILLCDAADGKLLAIIDSIEVTLRRTAAATALAAKHLARRDARDLCLVGCGDQARAQIVALAEVLPLRRVKVFDPVVAKAESLGRRIATELGISCEVSADIHRATAACDIIVTSTTATSPILGVGDVRPGTFIAAVGADSPIKHEIEPALMAASTIVVDSLDQCRVMGDLHHAIEAGAVTAADVWGDLGDVAAGTRGRRSQDEIIVFNSTGTALQDVASAAMIYERALEAGAGDLFSIGGEGRP